MLLYIVEGGEVHPESIDLQMLELFTEDFDMPLLLIRHSNVRLRQKRIPKNANVTQI